MSPGPPPSTPASDLPAICHSLMEGSPVPMAELEGAEHVVRYANPAFCRLAGNLKEALVGRPFAEVIREGDTCLAALDRVYRTGEAATHTESEHPDPRPAYWSFAMWAVLDAEHRPVGVMMQVTEATLFHQRASAMNEALLISSMQQHEQTERAEALNEQLRAEEQRQQLLLHELAHRGRNLLGLIQTLVSRSLSGKRSLTEAREALIQRIQALARSQTMLLQGAFEGAPLTEIVRLQFEAFSDRVKVDGPAIILNPRAAQTLALLLHELATNATKYGALSEPKGSVAIDWTIDGPAPQTRFKFRWSERGGREVVPPRREGFGRVLLEKAAAHEFGTKPKISFAPEGFSYEIDALLSAVAAKDVKAIDVDMPGRT